MKNLLIVISILTTSLLGASTLEILYDEREPYVQKDSNTIQGLVATPVIDALKNSKISYKLKKAPSKRHIVLIKKNLKKICAVGWFKKPQREVFAKFTQPAYQDKPMVLIVKKNNTKVLSLKNIETLLADKTLKALTKDSYSYGSFIDNKLEHYNTRQVKSTASNTQMLKMLFASRADYMFCSLEESKSLLNSSKHKDSLYIFKIEGLPKGNKRYLMCSKSVSDETITAINNHLISN